MAIFPVNRAVRLFTRKLIPYAPNKILAAADIYTFDMVLTHFYQNLPHAKTIINNELLVFLIEEVLKKLAPDFSYLPASQSPSARLIQKVTRMITELRRFGYSAHELSVKDAAEINIEPAKLEDFILVLTSLEEMLGDTYIDLPAARHQAALNLNPHTFNQAFPNLKHIYISGYGLFTPAMYLFIEKAKNVCDISVKLEYSKENTALFENTRPAFERFLAMGAAVTDSAKPNPLARLLFNRDSAEKIFDAQETITTLYCDNTEEEVIAVARKIYHLKKDLNRPLDKIAVTFNPLEKYVPVINRVFTEYGIPFNLSTGYPLKQSPLMTVMIRVLDTVNEGFDFRNVFHLCQSPFFKSDPGLTGTSLYKALVKGRIRHLSYNWDSRLLKNLENMGERLNDTLKNQLQSLKLFLDPFINFGTHNRSVKNFKADYLNLLRQSTLIEWYKHENTALTERQKEREFRAFNKFMKILDQFSWSMQMIYMDREIELKSWLSHLKSALNRSVYNLTEWPVEAVQIMPRLEIQAVDYDILFIGGLVDGQFPRSSVADIFLNDDNRQKLGLLANEDLLSQDRFIFFSLLNSAGSRTYLTIPRYSGEKSLVPSSFIDDLRECCSFSDAASDENPLLSKTRLWESLGSAVQKGDQNLSMGIKKLLLQLDTTHNFYNLLYKINAQNIRLNLFDIPGIYEGNLSHNQQILKFMHNTYSEHAWSISKLEDYAFCPMQYFLKRMLRLEEIPEFEEEVSPLERGNTVHNILYKFYSALREKGQLAFPAAHLNLLENITENELNRLPFNGFFWKLEKMRFFGRPGNPGLLKTFLNIEKAEIDKSGFIPAHFEYCFGPAYNKETDPHSSENLLTIRDKDGRILRINGKIDRIDIHPEKQQAAVFDYKTGNIDGKNAQAVADGLSFQLPVYIMALEQLLDNNLDVVYGGYYQVKDDQNCKREAAMADAEKYPYLKNNARGKLPNSYVKIDGEKVSFTQLTSHSKEVALQKQDEFLNATFKHTAFPTDKRCSNFCDYKRMCQKYVTKLKYQGKNQDLD